MIYFSGPQGQQRYGNEEELADLVLTFLEEEVNWSGVGVKSSPRPEEVRLMSDRVAKARRGPSVNITPRADEWLSLSYSHHQTQNDMDSGREVADPTDWLNTPLAAFSPLENSLHCQICKEFYDTPMTTSCSHTFCSKCIRTSLSNDGKCPACRAPDQASKLRNNWAIEELVHAFVAARPAALKLARRERDEEAAAAKRPGKRKRAAADVDEHGNAREDGGMRTTRSKSRRTAASQTSQVDEYVEIEDPDEHETFQPAPEIQDGLVPCPMCGKRMKEEAVFPHLDRCDGETKERDKSESRTPSFRTPSQRPVSGQIKPQERLSELSYGMMKENALRKKLGEIGIPGWGSKQLLVRRHTEWVNLWNANCDSNQPRTKREVLQDLDSWERTQGGRAPTVNGMASSIMRKDFDGDEWASRNKDDFSRLIADARRKKSTTAPAPDNPAETQERGTGKENTENLGFNSSVDAAHDTPDGAKDEAEETSSTAQPYSNNPEAIASIRSKVAAANAGKEITPLINAEFESPSTNDKLEHQSEHQAQWAHSEHPTRHSAIPANTAEPCPAANHEALLSQAHFGLDERRHSHAEHHGGVQGEECELPEHLTAANKSKKVPMFMIPAEPVTDIDGGGDMAAV